MPYNINEEKSLDRDAKEREMMAAAKNPFTPMMGKDPFCIAGRDQIIDDLEEVLDGEGNSPSAISLFVGPRGSGKTALLSRYASMAQESGWVCARATCTSGLLDELMVGIKRSTRHLADLEPARKVKSASIAKIGSIEWEPYQKSPSSWRFVVEDILDALEETGTGLLLEVDEVNSKLAEMETLVTVFQLPIDENRKVALAMAGLPYGVSTLLTGESTSFLRRAARYNLGPLSDYEVEEALTITMEQGGKSFAPDALATAVQAVGGFPYMLQLVGFRAWRQSSRRNTVNLPDVESAISIAQREVEERVYEATFYELSAGEKAFLYAMLQDKGVTKQAELKNRLGKSSGHVSNYKKRLLQQGIIQEKARGRLEFCLPGLREYLEAGTVDYQDL